MNADGFIINPSKVVKHLMTTIANETNYKPIAQIYWGNAETLFQTAKILVESYAEDFSGIELNTGCPSNTVMKCGWWSDMLKRRPETLELIRSLSSIVKKNKNLTFSIKSRAGLNEEDKPQQFQFLQKVSEYCDFISIHGRTLKQLYTGESDFWFIAELKTKAGCPIIANGGISSYQQAKELNKKRDFDGMMIGQWAIGNPRIFTPYEPSFEEKLTTIYEHLEMMIAADLWFEKYWEKIENYRFQQPTIADLEKIKKEINPDLEYRWVIEFRKYLFQYIKGIPNSREWKQEIIPIKTYGKFTDALEKLRFL